MSHDGGANAFLCNFCQSARLKTLRDLRCHETSCRKRLAQQQTTPSGAWRRLVKPRVGATAACAEQPAEAQQPVLDTLQSQQLLQEPEQLPPQQAQPEQVLPDFWDEGTLPSPAESGGAVEIGSHLQAAQELPEGQAVEQAEPERQANPGDSLDVPVSHFAIQHCGFGGYQAPGQGSNANDRGSDSEDDDNSARTIDQAMTGAGGQLDTAPQQQLSLLTPEEQAFVPISAITPGPVFDALLRSIKSGTFDPANIRFDNKAGLDQMLEESLKGGTWEQRSTTCTYSALGLDGVRRSFSFEATYRVLLGQASLLKSLVARSKAPNGDWRAGLLQDGAGRRVFSTLYDGDHIVGLQNEVDRGMPGYLVLPYILHGDVSTTTIKGGVKFRPLNLIPAWLARDKIHKMGSHTPIGLIPIIEADAAIGLKEGSSMLQEVQRKVLYSVMRSVLGELQTLSISGLWAVDAGGKEVQFVPLPIAYAADRKEHHEVFNIRQNQADIRFVTKQADFANAAAEPNLFVERTLEQMMEAASSAQEGLSMLREVSAASILPPPFDSFKFINKRLYQLSYPCYLHTVKAGIVHHLISFTRASNVLPALLIRHGGGEVKFLERAEGKRLLALLHEEVKAVPAFSGLCLPKGGLGSSMMTAAASDNLLVVMPVALLALPAVKGMIDLISSIVDLLEVETLFMRRGHTEDMLAELEARVARFQQGILQRFPFKSWAFPKFFMLRQLALMISSLGDPMLADTGTGQMHHKLWKLAYQFTNKHGDMEQLFDQMVRVFRRQDAARLLAEAKETQKRNNACRAALCDPKGPAAPQRGTTLEYARLATPMATATGGAASESRGFLSALGASSPAEGERARYGTVAASKAAELLRRLSGQPLFAQFERCLRLFLAGNPDPSATRSANLLEQMPHTLAQEVSVRSCIAIPYVRRPGEPATAAVIREGDDVAIRAAGGETWFGHVLLVSAYSLPSRWKEELGVFVRWYCAVQHTQQTAKTTMQRLRWEIARLPGGQTAPRCGVVPAKSILEPVLKKRQPGKEDHFFFNHFVRVGGR